MTGPGDDRWIEDWLSPPRFEVYLAAADGDRRAALGLYDWNARVAASLQHDLGHLEVGLRNAYDRALTEPISLTPGTHWTVDPWRSFPRRMKGTTDVNEKRRAALQRARHQAGGYRAHPGKAIAELSFGFWRHLTERTQHDPLWVPHLHTAFAPGTSRSQVDRPMERLLKLRNRVAHYEPLLDADLPARFQDLLTVAGLFSAPLRDYIADHSRTRELVWQRPAG